MSRRYSEIQSRYKKETGNNADKGMAYDIWIENRKWIINISDNDAIRLNGMINNNDYSNYIEWLENRISDYIDEIKYHKQKKP